MDTSAVQKSILDLLVVLNAAITNIRLYPPTSTLIINSVERLYNAIQSILPHVDNIEFVESEKSMLIQGDPLLEKDRKRPQVSSFLTLMLDIGVRSISIEKGVSREEVSRFLQIMGGSPEEINKAGGLRKIFKDRDIAHFTIDEKFYIQVDPGKSTASGADGSDADLLSRLLGDQTISKEMMERIQEAMKTPEALERLIQEGIQQLIDQAGDNPAEDHLAASVGAMMDVLQHATGTSKENMMEIFLNSLAAMPVESLLAVLTRNAEGESDDKMLQGLIDRLEKEKFTWLLGKVEEMEASASADPQSPALQAESVRHVFNLMQQSDKGKELLAENQEMDPAEAHKRKIERLKLALGSILKGETFRFPDISGMGGLAEVVEKLAETGKQFTVDAILDRLGEGARNDHVKTRIASAALLSKIDERFEKAGFLDQRIRLSRKLSAWLGFETNMTPVHQAAADRLQNLSQALSEAGRADEAGHILEIFNQIYYDELPKEEAVKSLARRFLQNLATNEAVESVLKDRSGDASKGENEDISSSLLTGAITIERLLDRLHESHNRSERNRVVQVITKIGAPAIPPILERIKQGGPWYYMRNLVLLLGRIGAETHLPILEPMLMHEDPRVQREAVFAMQNIGGKDIGSLFLRNLYAVEDDSRVLMISVLGLMKVQEAVPELMDLLQSKNPGKTKKTRNEILIKTCEALGRIGNTLAVPAIEKIRQPKGLFSLMGQDAEVRDAAEEALALLKTRNS